MTHIATAGLAALIAGGSALALSAGGDGASDPRIASTSFAEVCATDGRPGSAYSRAHRVVARKPVPGHQVDHIISLALGGADVDANIQIQPIEEALEKDKLEIYLAKAVCRYRTMALTNAQNILMTDWRRGYFEAFGHAPGR